MTKRRKPMPFVMVTMQCAHPECTATCQAKMEIWVSAGMPSSVVIIGSSAPGWTHENSRGRGATDCGYRCPEHPETADGGTP